MPARTDDVMTREVRAEGVGPPMDADRNDAAIEREIDRVLRHRLWFGAGQVRVRAHDGIAVLTGDVGRRSTADIAARLAAAVPGVDAVVKHIRFEFDDAELARSRVGRTHPFSAEPFHPGR